MSIASPTSIANRGGKHYLQQSAVSVVYLFLLVHNLCIISNMKQTRKGLTPARQRFVDEYIATDNATEAVRRAYPELAKNAVTVSSKHYLSVKGDRLLSNDDVNSAIASQRAKLEALSHKAIKRVEQLITSDNEQIATVNSWNTIRQVLGNPTQQVEAKSTAIRLNIDLSGKQSITEVNREG